MDKSPELKREKSTSALPFEDRRLFMRFPVSMGMRYFCSESESGGQGDLLDISANGMGIVTKRRLHVYGHMDIGVSVPNSAQPFYTTGEVVWVERVDFDAYRVGIRLDKPELMGVWRVLNGRDMATSRQAPANRSDSVGVPLVSKCISSLLKIFNIFQ